MSTKGLGSLSEDEWHLKNDSDGAVLMMTVLLYISGKHKQWDVFNLCSNVNKEQVYILSGGEIKLLLLHNRCVYVQYVKHFVTLQLGYYMMWFCSLFLCKCVCLWPYPDSNIMSVLSKS